MTVGQTLGSSAAASAVRTVALELLKSSTRQRITQEFAGRSITVMLHSGRIFALDAACFHFGGPLGQEGDIEELGEHTCIVCPWHRRKVDLKTGRQVDSLLDGSICSSQDVKQRVYPSTVDAEGWIWVDFSDSDCGTRVDSDTYNCSAARAQPDRSAFRLAEMPPRPAVAGATSPRTPFHPIERRAGPPSLTRQPRTEGQSFRSQQRSVSMRNANARMAVLRKMQASPAAFEAAEDPNRADRTGEQLSTQSHFATAPRVLNF